MNYESYNAYDELMSYFAFEFNMYIILVVIIFIGFVKSVVRYIKLRKSNEVGSFTGYSKVSDLLISLLAVVGLINGMFFQGVMSDIPMESGYVWVDKSLYLFVFAIVIINMQIIFSVLSDIKMRKLRKVF